MVWSKLGELYMKDCSRCGKGSSLFFRMVDGLDDEFKWCPICILKLLQANDRYLHGEFQGDQDGMIMK